MSQVRDHLNPGLLEGDLLGGVEEEEEQHVQSSEEEGNGGDNTGGTHHQQHRRQHTSRQRSHNDSEGGQGGGNKGEGSEEENLGGGHDSDPPIENQNPDEGDGAFEEVKHFVEDGESGEGDNGNVNRKKSQCHHRKRKNSLRNSDGSYVPPYKKNRFRRQVSVLPSKFLLGGNIRDPLNLASLADAKVNAEMNKATPKSSPMPVPSQQARQGQAPIPNDHQDPSGLVDPADRPNDPTQAGGTRQGKHKRRHRRRHGRKRTDSECSVSTSTDAVEEEEDEEAEAESSTAAHENRKRFRKHSDLGRSFESSDEDDRDQHTSRRAVQSSSTAETESLPERQHPNLESRVEQAVEKVSETPEQVVASSSSQVNGEHRIEHTEDDEVVSSAGEKNLVNGYGEDGDKNTPKVNGIDHDEQQNQGGVYPCKSSEYVPLSSSYAPSPYIFDPMNAEEGFEVKPFESPSLTNYCCNAATPSHLMEPFSPPPRPEIPHFQRRMQMMSSIPHRPPQLSLQRAVFQKPCYRRRFRHKSDPIVSPVIPQPGCSNRRNHHHHHNHNHRHGKHKGNDKQGNNLNTSNTSTSSNHSTGSKKGNLVKSNKQSNSHNIQHNNNNTRNEIKSFRPKDEIYQFGNYKQYYGYRTTPDGEDSRLWVMKKEWFRGQDVLDIGCNIGHVTLSIARDFEARRVHGIDIDNNLITMARKNIKHYMIHDPNDKSIVFPHSLPMIYGAMQPPTAVGKEPQQFPFNVMFSQENYVLSNDALLDTVQPEYDVIICLSVTKWIHLNFGDEGLKRFFHRVYRHLRKGGKLILEPQEWSSYYRKRKLTPKINENYKRIKFVPEQFQDFLVKEVGFTFVQRLGTPHHSKGFQRPILIFCKDSKGDSPMTEQNNAPSGDNEVPSEN